MPKLTNNTAQQAADAALEWGTSVVLEPGVFMARLREVTVEDGQKGPYWAWTYDIVDPDAPGGKRVWDNTSLSEKALGRLGKVFEGFGVPADTDTDELIGKEVWLQIGVRTIQSGARAGQQENEVQEVLRPVEYDDEAEAGEEF